jgi:hypothetical protein
MAQPVRVLESAFSVSPIRGDRYGLRVGCQLVSPSLNTSIHGLDSMKWRRKPINHRSLIYTCKFCIYESGVTFRSDGILIAIDGLNRGTEFSFVEGELTINGG